MGHTRACCVAEGANEVLAARSAFGGRGAIGKFVTFSRSLSVFLCRIRRDFGIADRGLEELEELEKVP